ncbi:MAG: hypothetical protein ACR2PQ_08740, partial [Myxococcota bacterium]
MPPASFRRATTSWRTSSSSRLRRTSPRAALAGILFSLLAIPAAADLEAGAAEGVLDAPLGLPLAGFTGRLGGIGPEPFDARVSPLARLFWPSTALHTRPVAKAVALTAEGETVVFVKADLIFADAFLLRAVEDLAGEATGEPLRGRVILSASHTHNGPGRFTENTTLMAGADTYDPSTFARYAGSLADVVVAALR